MMFAAVSEQAQQAIVTIVRNSYSFAVVSKNVGVTGVLELGLEVGTGIELVGPFAIEVAQFVQ
jgi:hypothetical protein